MIAIRLFKVMGVFNQDDAGKITLKTRLYNHRVPQKSKLQRYNRFSGPNL